MANAEEGAIAARADQHPECPELRRSPKTMYDSCLRAFVKNRKNPDLSTLRFLPPSVIIDIMHTVSGMQMSDLQCRGASQWWCPLA